MALTIKIKTKMLTGTCHLIVPWVVADVVSSSSFYCRGWKILLSFKMKCSFELHIPDIWNINNHIRRGSYCRRGPRHESRQLCLYIINTDWKNKIKWPQMQIHMQKCSHSKVTLDAEHILHIFKSKAYTSMWNVEIISADQCNTLQSTENGRYLRHWELHTLYCGIICEYIERQGLAPSEILQWDLILEKNMNGS